MEVEKEIQEFLRRRGIRRDADVCQLSFAKKQLTSVPDFSRFHFLRRLWLHNNEIRELSCRSLNCCLTVLCLHSNKIKTISGALSHLTCLRVLLLHNNQIRRLEETMQELRRMQQLQVATFYANPVSHEAGYRHHAIHRAPSIQVLDRKRVTSAERRCSFQMYHQELHRVQQAVVFGSRVT